MISAGEFTSRVIIFVAVVFGGIIAGYLVPDFYATKSTLLAHFELAPYQSLKIDMYTDLKASSLTISPSAETKFELTNVEPQVMTSPLIFHGVKLNLESADRKLFEHQSLHAESDVKVSFNWYAQYGQQNGTLLLVGGGRRRTAEVKTNIQTTYVFRNVTRGIYYLSAHRISVGACWLDYEVNGVNANYKTKDVVETCTESCKWSRSQQGAQYGVMTVGSHGGSAELVGADDPYQLRFQTGEIVIFVAAFIIAFAIKLPSFNTKSMAKVATKKKAMLQV